MFDSFREFLERQGRRRSYHHATVTADHRIAEIMERAKKNRRIGVTTAEEDVHAMHLILTHFEKDGLIVSVQTKASPVKVLESYKWEEFKEKFDLHTLFSPSTESKFPDEASREVQAHAWFDLAKEALERALEQEIGPSADKRVQRFDGPHR